MDGLEAQRFAVPFLAMDMAVFIGDSIQRHAQNHDVVVIHFLQSNQIGNLSQASGAPSGPEIQQDNLSVEIAKPHLMSFEILQYEIGDRQSPGLPRLRL